MRALLGAVVAFTLAACGGKPSERINSKPPAAAAPRDVLEYVPAAGLSWLVFARPARIAAQTALSAELAGLFPAERLDAYERSTGVDLRKLPRAAVAGYDLGVLYLAELPSPDAALIRERFAARLTHGGTLERVRPDLYRVSGTEADTPLALVSIENRLVASARGDLTLARIVEAYAMRRLKSPTALRGAALSSIEPPADDVLVAFYAPGPFTESPFAEPPRLLAASTALALTIRTTTTSSLAANVTLAGDWSSQQGEQSTPGPREELVRIWNSLAQSSTGRMLGLDSAERVEATSSDAYLRIAFDLPIAKLVAGLRALTSANAPEIFELIEQTRVPLPVTNP